MARVQVINEVTDEAPLNEWSLCLHWCRYIYDDVNEEPQYGYRFIWRRPNNRSLQAARGQARIPSHKAADDLWAKANAAGWGSYSAD